MLTQVILESQSGNSDSTLYLIEKFAPLLKKYAYRLEYEDAYNDLLLNFIEIIHAMNIHGINYNNDGGITSYLCASIHSSYIKHLIRIKRQKNYLLFSSLSDAEQYYLEGMATITDTYQSMDTKQLEGLLTKAEILVVKMIYYKGYTATDIAGLCGISRQAVNQMKKRALNKLKKLFADELREKK